MVIVQTFVIRVSTRAGDERSCDLVTLRGLIERVGETEPCAFCGLGELLAFIDERLAVGRRLPDGDVSADSEQVAQAQGEVLEQVAERR